MSAYCFLPNLVSGRTVSINFFKLHYVEATWVGCLIERWRSRYQDNTRRSCLQLESTIVQVETEKLKVKIGGNLPRRGG